MALDKRVRIIGDAAVQPEGDFVLYWMVGQRRTSHNFALDRAVMHAQKLKKPLLIFEPLRRDFKWQSVRMALFVVEGMAQNNAAVKNTSAQYFPYVEKEPGAGKGLMKALAQKACVVVSDYVPGYFTTRMTRAFGERSPVRFEQVDGNGLLPLFPLQRTFTTAYSFRRYLQKELPQVIMEMPHQNPLSKKLVAFDDACLRDIAKKWAPLSDEELANPLETTKARGFDASPGASVMRGGAQKGEERLKWFLDDGLSRYESERNQPDAQLAEHTRGTSGLSPYLHFGHVGSHQVVRALFKKEKWEPTFLSDPKGKRTGFWGLPGAPEAFLDELVTWREVGLVHAHRYPESYDSLSVLPDWAKQTMAEHQNDEREYLYSLEELTHSKTHDDIWNAAQRELLETGVMHNYLRMLWGKKIYQWTKSPEEALDVMIELNNRYALDGRDANSYTGILWVLGLFDRAWGPERPIFGKLRYMTSDSTRKKLKLKKYLQRYGDQAHLNLS